MLCSKQGHGHKKSAQSGFTLLEIILAMSILSSILILAINTVRQQIETRNRVQQIGNAYHGAHVAMTRIFDDIRHAFILSKQDQVDLSKLKIQPAFIAKSSLKTWNFTTQSHVSLVAKSPEANIAVVGYVLRPDPKNSSKTQLIRRLDATMNDSLERGGIEQVLVSDVKEFKLIFFDGTQFESEDWDTTATVYEGLLPKMVKIVLEAYLPPADEQAQDTAPTNKNTLKLETIVYLINTLGNKDLKTPLKEYKWF